MSSWTPNLFLEGARVRLEPIPWRVRQTRGGFLPIVPLSPLAKPGFLIQISELDPFGAAGRGPFGERFLLSSRRPAVGRFAPRHQPPPGSLQPFFINDRS